LGGIVPARDRGDRGLLGEAVRDRQAGRLPRPQRHDLRGRRRRRSVGQALPFSLKLVEGLLAESPEHRGLLLTAASGFTQYAYIYVQQDAEMLEKQDFEGARRFLCPRTTPR
jgi:hypothetical protein